MFDILLPMRVDESGGQGDSGHGRDGYGYSNIGGGTGDEKSSDTTTTAPSGGAASLDEDDPSSPTITTSVRGEHQ